MANPCGSPPIPNNYISLSTSFPFSPYQDPVKYQAAVTAFNKCLIGAYPLSPASALLCGNPPMPSNYQTYGDYASAVSSYIKCRIAVRPKPKLYKAGYSHADGVQDKFSQISKDSFYADGSRDFNYANGYQPADEAYNLQKIREVWNADPNTLSDNDVAAQAQIKTYGNSPEDILAYFESHNLALPFQLSSPQNPMLLPAQPSSWIDQFLGSIGWGS